MNRITLLARLLCTLLVAGAVSPAFAGPPDRGPGPGQAPAREQGPPPPQWEQLTPAQREMVIAVLRDRWNDNPQERARMLKHAERWKAMTPEQRRSAKHGMDRWAGMKPEERQRMRALYDHARQLSPEERAALREKLKTMTPEQRRAWMREQRELRQRRAPGDVPGRAAPDAPAPDRRP